MSNSTGVFEFIQQQSPLFVNKLYGNTTDQKADISSQAAWVCRGVLQSLCPLAKCYIMRLLFIEAAISSIDIFRWCEEDQRPAHNGAIQELLSLRILTEVDIPKSVEMQKDEQWFVLNQYFRNSIKFSMVHLSRPWREDSASVPVSVPQHLKMEDDKSMVTPMAVSMNQDDEEAEDGEAEEEEETPPTFAELEEYSYSRWNMILEFLVTADYSLPVSPRVVSYLLAAELMQALGGKSDKGGAGGDAGGASAGVPPQKRLKRGRQQTLSITARGYEYMLLDIQSQVWQFVLECLKKSVSVSSQVDVLYMIFMLSFCQAGTGYSIALLSPVQVLLLQDLREMGLVYIPRRSNKNNNDKNNSSSDSLFYPTHIAINMLYIPPPGGASSSGKGGDSSSAGAGAGGSRRLRSNVMNSMSLTIIVETNFQVVAYVTSNLHLAMLSLFVDTRSMTRLPNMVLGNITRDSAKAAFRLGISAQQILSFLATHAHPLRTPSLSAGEASASSASGAGGAGTATHTVIPDNVSDQLKLWQAEKKRFLCQSALVVDLHDVAQGAHLASLYAQLVRYATDLQVLVWANAQLREFAVTPEGFPRVQAYADTLDGAPR